MAFKIFRKIADMLDLDETDKTAGNVIAVNATEDGYELVSPTAGSGGAPDDVNYLVGTASGGLSAEIVVGTTPGGELGNTWASPTVDATHSGSSHAQVQAAAEATAAAALATHESDTTSVHGITDTSTLYRSGGTDVAVADGGTGSSTQAGARTNLGLGTISTQDSSNVTITGGAISGITDLAVADGGTGASTAATARPNLGAAPTDATYITQTANSELSAEQALSALSTGVLKVTTTTGVLSTAVANTDYAAATHASRHNDGGADEISLTGLSGDPADTVNKSLVDAKGDLFVGSADNTVIRKAVGSDGQVLTADAASTGGVKWATSAGGSSSTGEEETLVCAISLYAF